MRMQQIRSLKGRFPFSFGVTSYLYPADIAYNLERLRGLADEMELVLFEGTGCSNLPSRTDMRRLSEIAGETGMKFNVHLPLDIDIASPDELIRIPSLETVARIVEITSLLSPTSLTLHVPREEAAPAPQWRERVRDSLSRIAHPHDRFCVETLAWDLREIADIIEELGFSVCIDIGHLLLYGYDVPEFFQFFSGRVSMVHLHGVSAGRDHLSLRHLGEPVLNMIADTVSRQRYGRSLCLEVFSLQDFADSIECLERMFGLRREG
jgi:sugar phosphate isomerase/epimerase